MMREDQVLERIARSAWLRLSGMAIGPAGTPLGKPGPGLDFAEVRTYYPGDDIRHLDPRSSARLGQPHIKLFEPDAARPIWILLDGSRSMRCPMSTEQTKWDQARELAAVIAWGAERLGESVGLWNWGPSPRWIPLARGRSHTARVISALRESFSEGESIVRRPELAEVGKPRWLLKQPSALCILLGDWLATEMLDWIPTIAGRHEVRVVQFLDPWEIEGPPPGLYRFRDAETGLLRLVDAGTTRFRRSFLDQADRRRTELSHRLASIGIPLDCFRSDRLIEQTPNQLIAWNRRGA